MESVSISRRSFLRGRARPPRPATRPPWAREEADFVARCTRCEACLEACPTGILIRAEGGYPAVDFARGECTFCADCVAHCEPAALWRAGPAQPAWSLRAQIGTACLARRGVECRVCGEACPAGAIRFRPRAGGVSEPELDVAACSGCGACQAPCPAAAIEVARPAAPALEQER